MDDTELLDHRIILDIGSMMDSREIQQDEEDATDQMLLGRISLNYNITSSESMLYFLKQAVYHRTQSVEEFLKMWTRCQQEGAALFQPASTRNHGKLVGLN